MTILLKSTEKIYTLTNMTDKKKITADNYRDVLSAREIDIIESSVDENQGFGINFSIYLFMKIEKTIKKLNDKSNLL